MKLLCWFRQWRAWVAEQDKLYDATLAKEIVRIFEGRLDKDMAARDVIGHVRWSDRQPR